MFIPVFRNLYKRHCLKIKLKYKQQQLKQRTDYLQRCISTNALHSRLDSDKQQELVKLTIGELRERLDSGTIRSSDILQAFQRQALRLYEQGNSGICEFIFDADRQSKRAEKNARQDGKRTPLFGIPVSVGEAVGYTKYDATLGLIKRCDQPKIGNSVVVKVLKSAGAVPFVLTTTSQCDRSFCGHNVVFGDASNPLNASRIPGGGSMGEAVLLSQNGSPVGIGTDLLGGLRIPAAYCGLCSLRPTTNRLSSVGLSSTNRNSILYMKVCPGPIGKRVDDLVDMMRSLLTQRMFDLDPSVPPMPFNEPLYRGVDQPKLDIGYYYNLNGRDVMQTMPAVREIVNISMKILDKAGHRLVKFSPPNPSLAQALALRASFADGGQELRDSLSYEHKCAQLSSICLVSSLPYCLKNMSDQLLSFLGYRPLAVTRALHGLSTGQSAIGLQSEIADYRQRFFKACMSDGPLDAIICPVVPTSAPEANTSGLSALSSQVYTSLISLVDLPAGTVPVGFVDHSDVEQASAMAVKHYQAGRVFDAKVAASVDGSQGLPLSIQVVGMPYREEVVLRVMHTLESALRDDKQSS